MVKSTGRHNTITLSKEVVIRKSAVALSRSLNKGPAKHPQPPTPQDFRRTQQSKLQPKPMKKTVVESKNKKPSNLNQSTSSRRFEPISESKTDNESENIPLLIKRMVRRYKYLPESEGEPSDPLAKRAPVASAISEIAELENPQSVATTQVVSQPSDPSDTNGKRKRNCE